MLPKLKMIELQATTAEQTILLNYLKDNISEVLADKINNGVKIEKDGKTLVNRKDLTTFMKYACEEARKQAGKGATAACVDGMTVVGWAIHYFEEDSIEGVLYREDGTLYEPPKPVTKPYTPAAKPAPKPKTDIDFFDVIDGVRAAKEAPEEPDEAEPGDADTDECWTDAEIRDELMTEHDDNLRAQMQELEASGAWLKVEGCEQLKQQAIPAQPQGLIKVSETEYVDQDGMIHDFPATASKSIPGVWYEIFGDALIAR